MVQENKQTAQAKTNPVPRKNIPDDPKEDVRRRQELAHQHPAPGGAKKDQNKPKSGCC